MSEKKQFQKLVELFEETQGELQKRAARSVDTAMVIRNWLFGWYIIHFEQNGTAERAELYGKKLLENLARSLKQRGLKGLSVTNLKLYRSFYQNFDKIGLTVSDQSQSHRKNDALVELTLAENSNIHARQYQLYLPSKAELVKQIKEAERTILD